MRNRLSISSLYLYLLPPLSPSSIPISLLCLLLLLLLAGCTNTAAPFARQPLTITLTADGQTQTLTTTAPTVRALLEETSLELSETDEIDPPLFTPLTAETTIRIIRVTETTAIIEQSIPFQRKIVRNETMSENDPPLIIQAGQAGLQELTLRIITRDGLEAERRVTQTNIIQESQDEILMIGLGAGIPNNITFGGTLAYISSGNATIMRGATAFPEILRVGGELDQRVFKLSPTGSHLLYTRVPTDTTNPDLFNSLWVISTRSGSNPRPLNINNVLWADWNPTRTRALQIAYTTALATELQPGWEANNDLWLGELLQNEQTPFQPEKIVDSYPATYGWWGGNYAWSPNGRYLAYSYADEIGLIDLNELPATKETNNDRNNNQDEEGISQRQTLTRFLDFDTRADWVWLPSLSWSPDSRYLAYSQHSGNTTDEGNFETWAIDIQSKANGRFVPQAGIWGYPRWSPANLADGQSRIATLRAIDPLNSLRSAYALWLMDTDGSNATQIYPPIGELSYFSRDEQFMAWSGTGQDIAFIFDDDLHLLNLTTAEAYRITADEAITSHPTWAPYGSAITTDLPTTAVSNTPIQETTRPTNE